MYKNPNQLTNNIIPTIINLTTKFDTFIISLGALSASAIQHVIIGTPFNPNDITTNINKIMNQKK